MKKKEKWVWDITLEEADELYLNRHMNNYVYAALSVFHSNSYPKGVRVRPRTDSIPDNLKKAFSDLVQLTHHIDSTDTATVRKNYSYRAYRLFEGLKNLRIEDLDTVAEILSALAFIPIVAEKNDGLRMWKRPVIRNKTDHLVRLYELIQSDIGVAGFAEQALFDDEKEPGNEDPYFYLPRFIARGVGTVLGMIENGLRPEEAADSFYRIEEKMLDFEKEKNMRDQSDPIIQHSAQFRYMNTLYLYGGNTLERAHRYEEAFEWYTKYIYAMECTRHIGFYLTGLKATERLLCALRVAPKIGPEEKELLLLKDLVQLFLKQSFTNCASYSRIILDFVDSRPDLDLAQERFFLEDGKFMLFGGESTREPFLLSLLYSKIVNGVDYADINYGKYLIIDSQ